MTEEGQPPVPRSAGESPPTWREDRYLRRAFKHFGLLLGGRTTAALLGLAATALMARALVPSQFGTVVLIHTFAMIAKGLFNFPTHEAVVRYGVETERPDRRSPELGYLLGSMVWVDVAGALLAAVAAVLAAPLLGTAMGWDWTTTGYAAAYGTLGLFALVGTPKGVLRLCDRYDLLSAQLLTRPVARVAGFGAAWKLEAGVGGFLLAWYLAMLAEYALLLALGWRVARSALAASSSGIAPPRPTPRPTLRPRAVAKRFPGLWPFLRLVYYQSLLDLTRQHIATLAAGLLLGSGAAGLFRVARELSSALAKPAGLLRQAVFPDLTRLWTSGDRHFARLIVRMATAAGIPAGLVVALVWAFGERLLSGVMGEAYAAAAPLLTLLVAAAGIELVGAALRPASYAMGQAHKILRINGIATGLYLALFFALAPALGLVGPGVATVAGSALSVGLMTSTVRSKRR